MEHSHTHHRTSQQFNGAFAVAVILNLSFTIIEAIYAIAANSMSLLGDAAHNLGDVLGLLLAWGANWLLTKPSTLQYSYGYKRTTIIASLINALLLVGTGFIIGYEAILKLINPEPTQETTVILVATIGILINGGTALLFMRGSKEDLNIKGAFLHLAVDALISLGVVITGIIILLTRIEWLDPVMGLLIVITIFYGTWELLRDSILLLLDAVPASIDYHAVENYLRSIEGVDSIHDLHIWGLSTKETALTAHLIMPHQQVTDEKYHQINQVLKTQFKIHHVTLQIEQGQKDSLCHRTAGCH